MKIYLYAAVILALVAAVWAIDRNGYNRCKAKQAQAVADQKVDDAKAVSDIKDKAHIAKKERIRYVEKIRKIKVPCATATVPPARVDGVREFYRSQAGQGSD